MARPWSRLHACFSPFTFMCVVSVRVYACLLYVDGRTGGWVRSRANFLHIEVASTWAPVKFGYFLEMQIRSFGQRLL